MLFWFRVRRVEGTEATGDTGTEEEDTERKRQNAVMMILMMVTVFESVEI